MHERKERFSAAIMRGAAITRVYSTVLRRPLSLTARGETVPVEPCPLMPPVGLTALGEAIYAGGSVAPAINDDSKDEVDAVRACAPQARDLPVPDKSVRAIRPRCTAPHARTN